MNSDSSAFAAMMAMMMGSIMCLVVFGLVIVFILIVTNWRIYTKAGQPGWASIVPIYQLFVLMDIIRKPRSWAVIILVLGVAQSILTAMQPGANSDRDPNMLISLIQLGVGIASIYFTVRTFRELARVFGHGVGFTLGLMFLPFLFYPILAFGGSQYQPSTPALPGTSSLTH